MIDSKKEALLNAWLNLIISIDSQRVTDMLPFNETAVCNYLINHQDEAVTATDLCKAMKMQKSLMNRTLNNLEAKGLINRSMPKNDKRKTFITINDDENNLYHLQHRAILKHIDKLLSNLSEDEQDKLVDAIKLFDSITQASNKIND